MDQHNAPILINYSKCPPCSGLVCVGVCPLGILEVSSNKKPTVVEAESCTLCAVCANLCPTKAIEIKSKQTHKSNQ